jgi:poly-gamma-glutamate synthesis protein (capsule biosynthesis protein)
MKIEKLAIPGLSDPLESLVIRSSSPKRQTVRIIAVGDIGFSGGIRYCYQNAGNYDDLISEIKPILDSGDIFFGNLESPLVARLSPSDLFAGDPSAISCIQSPGITLLHLANNHILDYGLPGFESTINTLKEKNIIPLGVGKNLEEARKLSKFVINDIRIGWLGCGRTNLDQSGNSPVFWEFNTEELIEEIRRSKPDVDILVISIHTGFMYLDYPDPLLKSQVEEMFINGADLILMHHAHVLQSIQVQQDGSICCYNLGNFLLDSREGNVAIPILQKEQNESAIFVFDIAREGMINATAIPIYMDTKYVLHVARDKRGSEILTRLQTISNEIQNNYAPKFDKQRIERNSGPIFSVIVFHLRKKNWKFIWQLITRIRFMHLKLLVRYLFSNILRIENK